MKRQGTKHYSYKDLCHYLENHWTTKSDEFAKYRDHIDDCKLCWGVWNQVRWDAAWVKQGVQEVREYLGNKFDKYFDSSWALALDWNDQQPNTTDEIETFYRNTGHYIYNSTIFFESGDRIDLEKAIDRLIAKYNITSVLDYGCGVGNDVLTFLKKGLTTYGVDFESPSLSFLRWRLHKREYPVEAVNRITSLNNVAHLPPAEVFWSVDVLEHMKDPTAVFDKLHPATRIVAIYIDSDSTAKGRHPFHMSINRKALNEKLANKGFHQEKDETLSLWMKDK